MKTVQEQNADLIIKLQADVNVLLAAAKEALEFWQVVNDSEVCEFDNLETGEILKKAIKQAEKDVAK